MFNKSRTDKAKSRAKSRAKSGAKEARASVQDAATTAQQHLRGTVAPAVAAKAHDAREWATPKVERGLEVAAPKVEAAVERITPAVDAARDKLVDDLLPRLVDAVNAAAAAGAATAADAGETAKKRGGGAVAVLKGDAVARKPRRGRKIFLLSALVAAVGAAVAILKKRAPQDDPWAVAPGTYPTTSASTSESASAPEAEAALDSGAAGDALDDGPAEAEVPGLTADSAAAAEAISEAADSKPPAKKQGDPLTDPIDEVENADKP